MSTHDEGFGRRAGPNPGSQSEFAHQDFGAGPDVETWGNNALSAQKREVNLMAHGAGRPGQPAGAGRTAGGRRKSCAAVCVSGRNRRAARWTSTT